MVPLKRHKDPYLYLISTVIYTGARVAKPGQRRQVQGLVSQEFLGSNPIPRIWTRSVNRSVLFLNRFNQTFVYDLPSRSVNY